MTKEEAAGILCDVASRWGENTEEGFSRRVKATDTDQDCREIADDSDESVEHNDVLEVRDLWRAIDLMQNGAVRLNIDLDYSMLIRLTHTNARTH